MAESVDGVFESFCAFGAGKDGGQPQMDNAKFAKLFRDLKILDKNVTATDIDIIFSKVKSKAERKITLKQFKEALKLVAEKKYPGDRENGLHKLEELLKGKSPKSVGVTVSTPEVGGLTVIQALEIVRGCRGLNIVGGDLVEVNPLYDHTGVTSITAANLLFEMLCVLPGVKYYD